MPPPPPRIRPIALAVIRRGPELLLETAFDTVKAEHFARPPGGGIEFGEPASDAVRREIQEEFGLTFVGPRLLAVLENIFIHEDRRDMRSCSSSKGSWRNAGPTTCPLSGGQRMAGSSKRRGCNPGGAGTWLEATPDGFPELFGLEGAKSRPLAGPRPRCVTQAVFARVRRQRVQMLSRYQLPFTNTR